MGFDIKVKFLDRSYSVYVGNDNPDEQDGTAKELYEAVAEASGKEVSSFKIKFCGNTVINDSKTLESIGFSKVQAIAHGTSITKAHVDSPSSTATSTPQNNQSPSKEEEHTGDTAAPKPATTFFQRMLNTLSTSGGADKKTGASGCAK